MRLEPISRLNYRLPLMFFVMALPIVSPANADWYLSMSGGLGSISEEGDEVQQFRDNGHDVSEVNFDGRSGYGELAIGWRPEPETAIELGVAYIGSYEASVDVVNPDGQEFARDALKIIPGDLLSINLGLVFNLKLTERLTLQPTAGLAFWHQEVDVETSAGTLSESDSGIGIKGGASLLWALGKTWHLGAGWQNYLLEGFNIDVYALKLEKRF